MTEVNIFTKPYQEVALRGGKDPSFWQDQRLSAFTRLSERGIPSTRVEEWKYTSLRSLSERGLTLGRPADFKDLEAEIAKHRIGGALCLVLLNGDYVKEASPQLPAGVTVRSLSEFIALRPETVHERNPVPGLSAFTQDLSFGFARDGVVIEVDDGVELQYPLQILHYTSADVTTTLPSYFVRHVVRVGKRASIKLIESYAGAGGYVTVAALTATQSEGSTLDYVRLEHEAQGSKHLGRSEFYLDEKASLKSLSVTLGASLSRHDLGVVLNGQDSYAQLDGLYLAGSGQHTDHHTVVEHKVPSAKSSQLYKGVMAGTGRAVFNGKVFVREGAVGTEALQQNRNLLLSADAEIDTKPELEIDADDVKCSHGATVGQLNRDHIFYLKSRGLRDDEAIRLLTQAFIDDILLREPIAGVRSRVLPHLAEFLG